MEKIITTALAEYGVSGIIGQQNNQRILQYFADIGFSYIAEDETPWCAAFANWVLKQCAIEGTGKLNARSFLTWGQKAILPTLGDIVVLWRVDPNGALGHVGFLVRQTDNLLYILGGNEDNEVEVKAFSKTQLLDIRTLK